MRPSNRASLGRLNPCSVPSAQSPHHIQQGVDAVVDTTITFDIKPILSRLT